MLSRVQYNPTPEHMEMLHYLAGYVRYSQHYYTLFDGSKPQVFTFSNGKTYIIPVNVLSVFMDADHAQDTLKRESTSGYLIFFNHGIINHHSVGVADDRCVFIL